MKNVSGTWYRYSKRNLDKELDREFLFFTSSKSAAEKYKQIVGKNETQIIMFKLQGTLRLKNVATYLKENKSFKPKYNIINENGKRKDSTEDTADDEGEFYRELIIHAARDLRDVDGFYTEESNFHHEEMVLLDRNIIRALKNFEPNTSSGGTPRRNPAQRLRKNLYIEKRYIYVGNLRF